MLKLGSLIVVLSVSIGCRSDKLDTATTDTSSEIVDID
jgi:hypothetical protein